MRKAFGDPQKQVLVRMENCENDLFMSLWIPPRTGRTLERVKIGQSFPG